MDVLKRDRLREAARRGAPDSMPAFRGTKSPGQPADSVPPAFVGEIEAAFSVQIDGQWHAGIRVSAEMAVVEGPLHADSYGEMRDCRLCFPVGQLEIGLVRRAEVLRDREFPGATLLRFPNASSPAHSEMAALIRLLAVRQRREAHRAQAGAQAGTQAGAQAGAQAADGGAEQEGAAVLAKIRPAPERPERTGRSWWQRLRGWRAGRRGPAPAQAGQNTP